MESLAAASNYELEDGSPSLPLVKDMKESYDIGSERDRQYGNIWPPAGVCDEFQPTFVEFSEACYRSQLLILDAISLGLGLPMHTLREMHVAQHNELRLAHYPAVPWDAFSHSTRIATHSDFGSITLLFQDDQDGLQVKWPPRSGRFVDVASGGPYECILNSGNCLRKLTSLHAARHRVHLPNSLQSGKAGVADDRLDERFSLAYFGKPDRSTVLRPLLDGLLPRTGTANTFITAGELQNQRIKGTYA